MEFEGVITTIFSHGVFRAVAALIAVNILVGIFASIKEGDFQIDQTAEFLRTLVVPYVGGGLLCQLMLWGVSGNDFLSLPPEVAQISGTAVWSVICLMLLWRFLRHLKSIAPGLPLPLDPATNRDTATTSTRVTPTGTVITEGSP